MDACNITGELAYKQEITSRQQQVLNDYSKIQSYKQYSYCDNRGAQEQDDFDFEGDLDTQSRASIRGNRQAEESDEKAEQESEKTENSVETLMIDDTDSQYDNEVAEVKQETGMSEE